MRKLRFEGYSDDTFGEYGLTGDDVENCDCSTNPMYCGLWRIWKAYGYRSVFKSIM